MIALESALSPKQIKAATMPVDLFLSACPGSGKTRTAAGRIAHLMTGQLQVAGLSYTNVGVAELRKSLHSTFNCELSTGSIFDTLHGFILRYIFYPFGHLAMSCTKAPRLFHDTKSWSSIPVAGNNSVRAPLCAFTPRPDGSLIFRTSLPQGIRTGTVPNQSDSERAWRMKRGAAAAGIASPDDAMYWSLVVLRKHPELCKAVASRFDEVLIDEAQDTSELQLAIISELHNSGTLRSLALIGDLEQSICSFQGASPDGCKLLADTRGLNYLHLDENHRSSQSICNVTVNFCRRAQPDQAVGKDAAYPAEPELYLYDNPPHAVSLFDTRIKALGLVSSETSVLARTNELANEINGASTSVACSANVRTVLRATAGVRGLGQIDRRLIESVERIVATCAWGSGELTGLDQSERQLVRTVVMDWLTNLPALTTDLRSWIAGTRSALLAALTPITTAPVTPPGRLLQAVRGHENIPTSEAIHFQSAKYLAQTVHGVKGESRDAVLVIAEKLPKRGASQGERWSRAFSGEIPRADHAEELRIAYVALTRARKFCALAVPSGTPDYVVANFVSAGFRLPG